MIIKFEGYHRFTLYREKRYLAVVFVDGIRRRYLKTIFKRAADAEEYGRNVVARYTRLVYPGSK